MILRILDPELAETVSQRIDEFSAYDPTGASGPAGSSKQKQPPLPSGAKASFAGLSRITAFANAPAAPGETAWTFVCDGVRYPARLANLPCPTELHKSHDLCTYVKAVDVGQILVVHRDAAAMEAAEKANPPLPGFPSYHHSGLTPPMRGVVNRRFASCSHQSVPPDRRLVEDVEREIVELIARTTRDAGKGRKGAAAKQQQYQNPAAQNKLLEEVEEHVVDYEPYMDNYGNSPGGVEIAERDEIALRHPDLWLTPPNSSDEEGGGGEGGSRAASASPRKMWARPPLDGSHKKKKGSKLPGIRLKIDATSAQSPARRDGDAPSADRKSKKKLERRRERERERARNAEARQRGERDVLRGRFTPSSAGTPSSAAASPSSASQATRPSPGSGAAVEDFFIDTESEAGSQPSSATPKTADAASSPGTAAPAPAGSRSPINMELDIDVPVSEEAANDMADNDVVSQLNAIGDGVEDEALLDGFGFDFDEDMQL